MCQHEKPIFSDKVRKYNNAARKENILDKGDDSPYIEMNFNNYCSGGKVN